MSFFYHLDPPWMERVMELCDSILAKAAIEHPENEMLLVRLIQAEPLDQVTLREFNPQQGLLFEAQSSGLLQASKKSPRSATATRWQATGT